MYITSRNPKQIRRIKAFYVTKEVTENPETDNNTCVNTNECENNKNFREICNIFSYFTKKMYF